MRKALTTEGMALLKEAARCSTKQVVCLALMESKCPAQEMVPDVKKYISETIYDPEATVSRDGACFYRNPLPNRAPF
jgi:hypothetical protein